MIWEILRKKVLIERDFMDISTSHLYMLKNTAKMTTLRDRNTEQKNARTLST